MRIRTLGLLLALAAAGVVSAEVKVGEGRVVQPREGSTLRAEPKALGSTTVTVLPHGAGVIVQEVQGAWTRVSTPDGKTGWLRTTDLVEAGALTQRAARAGAVTTVDVTAAGRQFDDATETSYRAEKAELDAAYRLVDQLEAKSYKPGSPEIEAFARDGRLGGGR